MSFKNYTYFTLPCRGLGLVGLALDLLDWPTIVLPCFHTVCWVIWPVKIVPKMTCNVFGGTKTLLYYYSLKVVHQVFCGLPCFHLPETGFQFMATLAGLSSVSSRVQSPDSTISNRGCNISVAVYVIWMKDDTSLVELLMKRMNDVHWSVLILLLFLLLLLLLYMSLRVMCCLVVTQARLEAHVRNVQLFHQLLQVQTDWLTDAEGRVALLRHTSKVFAHVQRQLDSFQVGNKSVHRVLHYAMFSLSPFPHILSCGFIVFNFYF